MPKIHEILKLDLEEDIKSVINLEDRSEAEVKYEIDSYIVTENIGKYFSEFASKFTSNIKETGVWISGFYGSGKSYFGKMLGYVLENSDIMGTQTVERFINRLSGLKNAGLLENSIRSLSAVNSRVVALDIAQQSTVNGLSFTLFQNFLKSLGFLDNIYGYLEYSLFMDRKYEAFLETVHEMQGAYWSDVRKISMNVPKIMKRALTKEWFSENEYEETLKHLNNIIKGFSANRLKDELQNYLEKNDEKIVFIFDEASEAISQKKYDLLDLEGLSEAMSGIAARVWTIAIAQEKLDDVINNSNISKSQLIKVTDRFKTKIHLESTEVDIIIKNRLLQKKDKYFNALTEFYKMNEGTLSDATNLKSSLPTKIENSNECATYYPFHRYQFDLLQRFLFSSNALAATQVAARGMLITIFDVLRNKLKNRSLFEFASAFFICDEAQSAPPSALVNKYDNAKKIIRKTGLDLDGERLLKTIHFLSESELALATPENITKSYITDMRKYYDVKKNIDDALDILTDAKILLVANNNYKITSDLETKLLDEMNGRVVELFIKKRNIIGCLKKSGIFKSVSNVTVNGSQYNFAVLSDQDDEIVSSTHKNLQVRAYSIYSITANDREEFIETVKLDTQYEKGKISIVPQIKTFKKIDTLLEEIQRLEYMQEKYGNDTDANIKQIIREFSVIKVEREKWLMDSIGEAYKASTAIYLFDTSLLSEGAFSSTITGLQKKVIKNVYTKRPAMQISEKLAQDIIKEKSDKNLLKYNNGDYFKFFDNNGNFIGDGLQVTEEVTALIQTRYADGKSNDKAMVLSKEGESVGNLPVHPEAKKAYLAEEFATKEFPLNNIKDFIQNLPEKEFTAEEKTTIIEGFPTLYQKNNDLEEFCIRHQVNPINVWYWFKESNVVPQQRMNDIAMEFLADLIREILMEDEDGIVPLVRSSREEILIDRIEKKFMEKGFSSAQFAQFDKVLGREINDYLNNHFFKALSDHLNLFMYLPKTPFIWHITSGPNHGFDAYIIIYKWSRDRLFLLKSVYIEKRETALRNRQSDLQNDTSAKAQNEKDLIFKQLKEIAGLKTKIEELLAEGYAPILDDGVGKNIAPLQKKGIIAYDVLNKGQLEKYLHADW